MNVSLHQGDCLVTLRGMADNSVDSIVTDPPYGISFMGKKWDYDVPSVEIWAECLRVLKPGGHLLAFAGTRTQHRMAVRIEDAGFEIRDMLAWVYSQGFPKSADVSKQIDQQEKNRWVKISKAIDNASLSEIAELWINSKNANAAGLSFQRKQTEAGLNTQKNGFAHGSVLLRASHKNCDAFAVIAELNSTEAHPTSGGNCSSAQSNAESATTALRSRANTAGSSQENHEATRCMADFSALDSAWGWQGESRADKLKAVEALKIWLGSNPSSRRAATSALCAALTDDLKRITLSQSKTFLSFDTTRQMACASVINATITESTAASLISFTADTLKSKAIDKAAGAEREVVGTKPNYHSEGKRAGTGANMHGVVDGSFSNPEAAAAITAPATDAARQWQGWGTALKPALEPITMARKPLVGTVAANVLEHGTGALNIDGCRVGDDRIEKGRAGRSVCESNAFGKLRGTAEQEWQVGRWPANLIHDGSDEVVAGFPQAKGQQGALTGSEPSSKTANTFGEFAGRASSEPRGDTGSAARFFYCAKASKADREEGLDGAPDRVLAMSNQAKAELARGNMHEGESGMNTAKVRKNHHPTVKPTDLMAYLCRLVTPPGGVVLDPFMGSGSTGKAALREGFGFIGCEMSPEYMAIASARIEAALAELYV